jgi:TonB family protein
MHEHDEEVQTRVQYGCFIVKLSAMTWFSFRTLLVPVLTLSTFAYGQSNTTPTPNPAAPATTSVPTTNAQADSKTLEPISSFLPTYPSSAENDKLQGLVVLKISVSTSGRVDSTQVISGDPLLAQAAIAAVTKWKFKPFIRDGAAVTTSTNLRFDFIFCDQSAAEPSTRDAVSESEPHAIRVVRISQKAAEQLITHKVDPTYPELAALSRIQGVVLLRGVIDKDGTVQIAGVISGHPLLAKAAFDAVKQWRYRPFILDGQPVNVQTTIAVNFALK